MAKLPGGHILTICWYQGLHGIGLRWISTIIRPAIGSKSHTTQRHAVGSPLNQDQTVSLGFTLARLGVGIKM